MTTTTTLPTPQPDKSIPLSLALAILSAIFIGGSALIAYCTYRPAKPANMMRVITPPPGGPRVAGGAPQSPAANFNVAQTAAESDLSDGIHPGASGDILFKAGDTYLRVLPGKETRYSFGYFTIRDIEWEHGYLTQGIRRILTQDDFAKELSITDDQKKRLEKLPAAPSAKWSPEDREYFISQYQGWSTASGDAKSKAAEEFLKALRAYGEQKRAADQKLMTERIASAKSILTEKQIARINPIPKWDIKGTTKPAQK